MDFTAREMKVYIFVDTTVLTTKNKLDYRVQLAPEYNNIVNVSERNLKNKHYAI